MSPLMERLAQQLSQETDEYKRAEIVAQQAAYSARVGEFGQARTRIANVRSAFGDGRSGRVTALVMIAEGLLAHYEVLGSQARDRLMRAQLLGDVMRDPEIIALASAWRAHVEYESSSFDVAAHALKKAVGSAADDHHSARSRCCIVLHNALAFVGEQVAAQEYFAKGREHAVSDGDQASIDALLHNKATYGVAHLWVQRCMGVESSDRQVKLTRLEVESSRNLQQLVQIGAHAAYIDLSECNLCVLEGRYPEALSLLERVRDGGPYPSGHFNDGLSQMLAAFCLARLNRYDEALVACGSARTASWGDLDVDDRLVVSWIVSTLAEQDERFSSRDMARAALAQAVEEYSLEVDRVRRLFEGIALS
jgi:tetratricopeptide (TPR) repeat protein